MASHDELFELFWGNYPSGRKTKKGEARRIFKTIITGKHRDLKATPDELIAAALRYSLAMGEQHPYVKMPSTWLNGGCWEDDDMAPPEPVFLPTNNARPSAGSTSTRSVGIHEQLSDRSWAKSPARGDDHG